MTSQVVSPLFPPSAGETGSLEEVVLGEHPFTVQTRICKALWLESRPLSRDSKCLGILWMVVIPTFLLKRSFPGSALGELSAIPRSKPHTPIRVPPNIGIPGKENHTRVMVLPYSGPGIFSFSVLKMFLPLVVFASGQQNWTVSLSLPSTQFFVVSKKCQWFLSLHFAC